MDSVSPVIPGNEEHEVTYAKDQSGYRPLTVLRTEKCVMSRWRLTDEERKHIADGGDLFICQLNFGGLLQPILPVAEAEGRALAVLIELGT
jgi:hypothetical protein